MKKIPLKRAFPRRTVILRPVDTVEITGLFHYNYLTMKQRFLVPILSLFLATLLHPKILHLKLDGPIDGISQEYVADVFQKAASIQDARLIIIDLDTPGGFDTAMREIIKTIMNAPVPVAVHVRPRGARAASAGFFITLSADFAIMAPGTNMGAATPVSITGGQMEESMKKKIVNDAVSYIKSLARGKNRNQELAAKAVSDGASYTAEECLKGNLIDFIAEDTGETLKKLEGRTITMGNGETRTLALDQVAVVSVPMSARQKFLRTITNPNLAYFLLIFGLIGLYLEFTHPGTLIPGVLGGISLLLAFLAFQILPINYVGLALILLALGLFVAEIKVQGFGMLGIGGIVAFILGSVMLIDAPVPEMRPAMTIVIVISLCFGAVFLFLTYKVFHAMRRKPSTGQEGLVGEVGTAKSRIDGRSGKVFIHGEWWDARSEQPVESGDPIVVLSVEGFTLHVRKIENP